MVNDFPTEEWPADRLRDHQPMLHHVSILASHREKFHRATDVSDPGVIAVSLEDSHSALPGRIVLPGHLRPIGCKRFLRPARSPPRGYPLEVIDECRIAASRRRRTGRAAILVPGQRLRWAIPRPERLAALLAGRVRLLLPRIRCPDDQARARMAPSKPRMSWTTGTCISRSNAASSAEMNSYPPSRQTRHRWLRETSWSV